jgi:hypothetical protein
MRKTRAIKGVLAGLAGLALLVGGVAVASNMGFKYVTDVSDGTAFNLSLPWNNNYTDAGSLRDDTGAGEVGRFNADETLSTWDGAVGTNFAIEKSSAYLLFDTSDGSPLQSVIVGSHDPNFTLDLPAGELVNAAAPYHQTLVDAGELLGDLNTQLGASAVSEVGRFNADETISTWDGAVGTNFALTLGQGVLIFADAGGSGYQWPHY